MQASKENPPTRAEGKKVSLCNNIIIDNSRNVKYVFRIIFKSDCVFADVGSKKCSLLKTTECENCKFYKTEKEYDESRGRASKKLSEKGLVAYRKTVGKIAIVSTKKEEDMKNVKKNSRNREPKP